MIRDNVLLIWAGFVLLAAICVYALAREGHMPAPWCEYIDTTAAQ
jgi:hypothetical protein